jgi:hypothetical protein
MSRKRNEFTPAELAELEAAVRAFEAQPAKPVTDELEDQNLDALFAGYAFEASTTR